jgi:hypothetical protein
MVIVTKEKGRAATRKKNKIQRGLKNIQIQGARGPEE